MWLRPRGPRERVRELWTRRWCCDLIFLWGGGSGEHPQARGRVPSRDVGGILWIPQRLVLLSCLGAAAPEHFWGTPNLRGDLWLPCGVWQGFGGGG